MLDELGSVVRHVGANGQGVRLKLAVNISLAAQMLAFSEGVLLAERGGIERELAVEVITESPVGSPFLHGRAPLVVDLPDQAWFDVELAHKDIRLALATGQRDGVQLPSAALADEWLTTAASLGYGHSDIASLFAVLAQTPPALASSAVITRKVAHDGRGRGAARPAAQRESPRGDSPAAAELLLARGLGAVSMDAVAEQAGVSKATIYRWWPTKETLALDALHHEWARRARPAPGDRLAARRPARAAAPVGTPRRQAAVRARGRRASSPRRRPILRSPSNTASASSNRAATRPARSSCARSSAASCRPRPTSSSRSTSSTGRSTTASSTATPPQRALPRDLVDTVLAGLQATTGSTTS